MLVRKVHIRRWTILFLFSFNADDLESITDALVWAQAPDSIIYKVQGNASADNLNEGFTFSNPETRRTVFGISEASSGPEVLDSTVHEIIHIVQHIAFEDDMDMFSEDVAYLGGDISRAISDIVCELSCPHCSRHE